MAQFRYFADINGQAVELSHIEHRGNGSKASAFWGFLPGVDLMTVKRSEKVQCTRAIQMKSNPSHHVCSARCVSATGFLCECECGGKNHGAGKFSCVAEAA